LISDESLFNCDGFKIPSNLTYHGFQTSIFHHHLDEDIPISSHQVDSYSCGVIALMRIYFTVFHRKLVLEKLHNKDTSKQPHSIISESYNLLLESTPFTSLLIDKFRRSLIIVLHLIGQSTGWKSDRILTLNQRIAIFLQEDITQTSSVQIVDSIKQNSPLTRRKAREMKRITRSSKLSLTSPSTTKTASSTEGYKAGSKALHPKNKRIAQKSKSTVVPVIPVDPVVPVVPHIPDTCHKHITLDVNTPDKFSNLGKEEFSVLPTPDNNIQRETESEVNKKDDHANISNTKNGVTKGPKRKKLSLSKRIVNENSSKGIKRKKLKEISFTVKELEVLQDLRQPWDKMRVGFLKNHPSFKSFLNKLMEQIDLETLIPTVWIKTTNKNYPQMLCGVTDGLNLKKGTTRVQFDHTELPIVEIPIQYAELAKATYLQNTASPTKPSPSRLRPIVEKMVPLDEQGDILSIEADDEYDDDESEIDIGNDQLQYFIVGSSNIIEEQSLNGVRWEYEKHMQGPIRSSFPETHIKRQFSTLFESPVSSFLAYLPIKVWIDIVYHSNLYAEHILTSKGGDDAGEITGAKWYDLTIQELMVFIGILLGMVLRPMPGHKYPDAWSLCDWQIHTKHMTLRRFRQIRTVLNCADHNDPNRKGDLLHLIRPMMDVIKRTLPSYVNVSNELSLDETSIPTRNNFARSLIYYNPMKPRGKFHFKFFVVCCATTGLMLRFKMQCPGNADSADRRVRNVSYKHDKKEMTDSDSEVIDDNSMATSQSESSMDYANDEADEPKMNKINELVLELVRPYFSTYRTVTMDNYYGSPEVLVYLLQNGMFGRCTFRKNRKFCPLSVQFTKSEAKYHRRGACRFATSVSHNMTAWGWVDGNPVCMMSTADGTDLSTVKRQVGREKRTVMAPDAVKNYNKFYGGVDHFDSLLSKYSITKRHRFNCYYISLMMTMIDFAITQAYLSYKMNQKRKSDKADVEPRIVFMERLVNEILTRNWIEDQYKYYSSKKRSLHQVLTNDTECIEMQELAELGVDIETNDLDCDIENVTGHEIMQSGVQYATRNRLGNIYQSKCLHPVVAKLVFTKPKTAFCQICDFEGRGTKLESVNFCTEHNIRACTKIYNVDVTSKYLKYRHKIVSVTNWDWACKEIGWTCWQKFHIFYYQKALFNPAGRISTKSELYRSKQNAIGQTARSGRRKGLQNKKYLKGDDGLVLAGRMSIEDMVTMTQNNFDEDDASDIGSLEEI